MELQRIDFIFSYWIFSWYLLYITNIIEYSPKFVFLLGIIENIILLFFITQNGSTIETIIKFILINIIIKIVPYYTIINDKIKDKDILVSSLIFIIYNIWLYINNTTIVNIYYKIYNSLINNKENTPGMMMIKYLIKK